MSKTAPGMQTAGYAEILRRLHLFFALCETLDLRNQAEQGRFGIYEGRIRHLISNIEAIRSGQPEGPLFARIAPELPFFVEALCEALEVGEMTEFGQPDKGTRAGGWDAMKPFQHRLAEAAGVGSLEIVKRVDSPGKKWTSYGEVLWMLHWMTLLAFVVLLVVAVGGTATRARAAPCTAVSCWTPLREVRVDAGKLGV